MGRIGYIQVNSKTQNIDRQIKTLKDVTKIFVDNVCVQFIQRPQLNALMKFISAGDIVVITELDQLSRKKKELIKIMKDIQR